MQKLEKNTTIIPYPYQKNAAFYNQLAFLAVEYRYEALLAVLLDVPTAPNHYQSVAATEQQVSDYGVKEIPFMFEAAVYQQLANSVQALPAELSAEEFINTHQAGLFEQACSEAYQQTFAYTQAKRDEMAVNEDLCSEDHAIFTAALGQCSAKQQQFYQQARQAVLDKRASVVKELVVLAQSATAAKEGSTFKDKLLAHLSQKQDVAEQHQTTIINQRAEANNTLQCLLKKEDYSSELRLKLKSVQEQDGLTPMQKQASLLRYDLSGREKWPEVLKSIEQITVPWNIVDSDGNNLLHRALKYRSLSCARLIMQKQQGAKNTKNLITQKNRFHQTPIEWAGLATDSLFLKAALCPEQPMLNYRSDFLKAVLAVLTDYEDQVNRLNTSTNLRIDARVSTKEVQQTLLEIQELKKACQVAELELFDEHLADVIANISAKVIRKEAKGNSPLPTTKRSSLKEAFIHIFYSDKRLKEVHNNVRGYMNINFHKALDDLLEKYQEDHTFGYHFYDGLSQSASLTLSMQWIAALHNQQVEEKQRQIKVLTRENTNLKAKCTELTTTVTHLKVNNSDLAHRLLESQQQTTEANQLAIKMAQLAIERKDQVNELTKEKIIRDEELQEVRVEMREIKNLMMQFKNSGANNNLDGTQQFGNGSITANRYSLLHNANATIGSKKNYNNSEMLSNSTDIDNNSSNSNLY